ERVAQKLTVTHKDAAALDGNGQPLVWVQGYGVGVLEAAVARAAGWHRGGDGAVGAVDVEPESLGGAEVGELGQRIDGACAHGASTRRHTERPPARGPVGGDGGAQRQHIHAEPLVYGHA